MLAQKNNNKTKPRTLKTLLTWKAPARPFKKREREYFTTIGAIVFLIALILLFLKEWLLIVVIIALVFVAYVLATVEPGKVEHKITNRGIVTGGKTYAWNELERFWLTEKWGQKILHVDTFLPFPRRLMLLLGEVEAKKIKNLLADYLRFERPEKSWIEKASDWLSRQVPLEKS